MAAKEHENGGIELDLQSVTIEAYRKFEEAATLRTTGKLVALLGPNEAGKTSILQAISKVGKRGSIQPSDISRTLDVDDNKEVLSARFKLDHDDLEDANLSQPTWYVWSQTKDGRAYFEFDPNVSRRSLDPRKKLLSELERIRSNNPLWGRIVNDHAEISDDYEDILSVLSKPDETLGDEDLSKLKSFGQNVFSAVSDGDPKYFFNLPSTIDSLLDHEKTETPTQYAQKQIQKRMPKILFFSNDERLLEGSYDVEELSDKIPPALSNIAMVAGLDLKDFIKAIQNDDMPTIARMKGKANHELSKRFSETWSQSGIHVAFEVNNNQIQILIQEENYNFTKLAERSDGLRQFVALHAFATCERAENPILLIDEAEMRLHYDAQADLVQMLAKQKVSSKIIYTTHSAGCLPEDLGNGVRIVETSQKEDGSFRSSIRNQFWLRSEGGLEPLLFGMGAATLAFFPVRKALLTEGESDMILLPSMFKEVLKRDHLAFQIVPGLSKTSGINLPILARNGKGVGFVLDHDEGGRSVRDKIVKAGFEEESVFFLRAVARGDSQIEDFINPSILILAVKQLAEEKALKTPPIRAAMLPSRLRLERVAEWLGYDKPGNVPKTLLAYHILDVFEKESDMPLVDPKKRHAFERFSRSIDEFMSSAATI